MGTVWIAAVGWTVAVLNGLWGYVRNRALQREVRDSRTEARVAAEELPQKVATVLGSVLPAQGEGAQQAEPPNAPAQVKWQDLTGDGEPELLVEHGVGAHSKILHVFGKLGPYSDFQQIGEMFTDHNGFSISDFDSDGRVEIRALLTDFDAWTPSTEKKLGHSMAQPPLVETIWRWNGKAFEATAGRKWDTLRERERPSWADF